jgi:glycosyltransferase involved in cell wall biosynthesis
MDIRTGNVIAQGLRAWVADWLTAQEARAFTAAFVIDDRLGRHLLGKRPFYHLEQGVDLSRFAGGDRVETRRKLGYLPHETVILYTGALNAQRRPFTILESFAQVAQQHTAARLLMVGDSDLLSPMNVWLRDRQLMDRVCFLGRVPYAAIQDYVAAADIGFAYVPATPNFEHNPPLKTAEFLAAGLPTVATDTHGNRVYITHEQNGLLAADDPAALAGALCRLLDDPVLRARLVAAARPSVMRFDWRTIVQERLLPVYQRYVAP